VEILIKLLEIRSGFTKKLMVDIASTVYTVHDVEPYKDTFWNNFSMKRGNTNSKKKRFIDCRRSYGFKNILIFVFSLIIELIIAFGTIESKYFKHEGIPLVFGNFFGASIIVATVFLMFFVSFDLMTVMRAKCRCR